MKNENILGLRTVVYMVTDLNKAKDWYTKAFGTQPYFDEAFYVGFNIGGYELGLLPEEKAKEGKSEGAISYWGVEDINSVFNKMISLGAKTHEKPTNVGGELMVASLIDPWGNMIGLIYNPSFKLSNS
ncbi:VOC family protein [Ancylomarina sp. 16SWW S1-10-2]|uniref:VOC family protein n=1 Tax=Ancylomarina sp. 16SWW S1-10-2 TaxID=2499681 RepID=UPI0012AE2895|nr:VOC family protein [Ancylomarina sp. 16SWW S1-10-2]MRT92937.1 VOC family protein [Ancylomarina sp. 16SWW S1-10-2]